MADWKQKMDFEGNSRRMVARVFAQYLMQDVIPLLSGFDEREQMQFLTHEAERLLSAYSDHLEKTCAMYRKETMDAINSVPRPMIIWPGPTKDRRNHGNL